MAFLRLFESWWFYDSSQNWHWPIDSSRKVQLSMLAATSKTINTGILVLVLLHFEWNKNVCAIVYKTRTLRVQFRKSTLCIKELTSSSSLPCPQPGRWETLPLWGIWPGAYWNQKLHMKSYCTLEIKSFIWNPTALLKSKSSYEILQHSWNRKLNSYEILLNS